tara:strand:- start:14610 stop:14810 length:201 start_codon:yes stop_codon:yes gene_type:complete
MHKLQLALRFQGHGRLAGMELTLNFYRKHIEQLFTFAAQHRAERVLLLAQPLDNEGIDTFPCIGGL